MPFIRCFVPASGSSPKHPPTPDNSVNVSNLETFAKTISHHMLDKPMPLSDEPGLTFFPALRI